MIDKNFAHTSDGYVYCPGGCLSGTYHIRWDQQTQEYVIECAGARHEVRRLSFLASGPVTPPAHTPGGSMMTVRIERYTILVYHQDGSAAARIEASSSSAGGAIVQAAEGNGAWAPVNELIKERRRM